MPSCHLEISLDEPDRVYQGGATIAGTVKVLVDSDVVCNGLHVSTMWTTQGRGNIAGDTVPATLIYEGSWDAGDALSYRFELPVIDWPPSYQGHYLNVEHLVAAKAELSWAKNATASVPFQIRPVKHLRIELQRSEKSVVGLVVRVIAAVIAVIVFASLPGFGMRQLSILGWMSVAFVAVGLVYWFLRFMLPSWALGKVEFNLHKNSLAPGQCLSGDLSISPRKRIAIDGITTTITAEEQCTSGTGTDRAVHCHQLFQQVTQIVGPSALASKSTNQFPVVAEISHDAPYSLSLGDNELVWTIEIRVHIPRWPDWYETIPFRIAPQPQNDDTANPVGLQLDGEELARSSEDEPFNVASQQIADGEKNIEIVISDDIEFSELASRVWAVRDQKDSSKLLVQAVIGLSFDFHAVLERRLLYVGAHDKHSFQDGQTFWGHYPDPPLPLVLYAPRECVGEFEHLSDVPAAFSGTVVGWDTQNQRLQIRLK